MINSCSLRDAQDYFEKHIRGGISIDMLRKCQNAKWKVRTGVPHLIGETESFYFIPCNCGLEDCVGIKLMTGSIN